MNKKSSTKTLKTILFKRSYMFILLLILVGGYSMQQICQGMVFMF